MTVPLSFFESNRLFAIFVISSIIEISFNQKLINPRFATLTSLMQFGKFLRNSSTILFARTMGDNFASFESRMAIFVEKSPKSSDFGKSNSM